MAFTLDTKNTVDIIPHISSELKNLKSEMLDDKIKQINTIFIDQKNEKQINIDFWKENKFSILVDEEWNLVYSHKTEWIITYKWTTWETLLDIPPYDNGTFEFKKILEGYGIEISSEDYIIISLYINSIKRTY